MPLQTGHKDGKCFIKWGDLGHEYFYKCGNAIARQRARKQAIAQAVAIGEFVEDKVSFDYNGTLTRTPMKNKAKQLVKQGVKVYVISATKDPISTLYPLTDSLGIPRVRVFATGSNAAKIAKIKELGITEHYDNNPSVIKQLGKIGHLFQLSLQERFSEFVKFFNNDNTRPIE